MQRQASDIQQGSRNHPFPEHEHHALQRDQHCNAAVAIRPCMAEPSSRPKPVAQHPRNKRTCLYNTIQTCFLPVAVAIPSDPAMHDLVTTAGLCPVIHLELIEVSCCCLKHRCCCLQPDWTRWVVPHFVGPPPCGHHHLHLLC